MNVNGKVVILLFESLKNKDVRTFLQQTLTKDCYKSIEPPESLKNNYYLEKNFAFFIAIDAIVKFEQVINDDNLIDEYIEQLKRIFKKFTNYNDIKKGIYLFLEKALSEKIDISGKSHEEKRAQLLYYVYDKYIVNGYFYFGFCSNYTNEITCLGLRKENFILDERLEKINQIISKVGTENLFKRENTSITDNVIVAIYFALLSPSYISDLSTSSYLKSKKYNKDCLFFKNLDEIRNNLLTLSKEKRLNNKDTSDVINNFVETYSSDKVNNTKPCIALIKRSTILKNELKDIQEIINNKDESIASSLSLIMESRYNSYEIENDIAPSEIRIIELPKYSEFLLGLSNFAIVNKNIDIVQDDFKISEEDIITNKEVNAYGAVSVAIVGSILIIAGLIISVILKLT